MGGGVIGSYIFILMVISNFRLIGMNSFMFINVSCQKKGYKICCMQSCNKNLGNMVTEKQRGAN